MSSVRAQSKSESGANPATLLDSYKQIWAIPLDQDYIEKYINNLTPNNHSHLSLRFQYLSRTEKTFIESIIKNLLEKNPTDIKPGEWMLLGKAHEHGLTVKRNEILASECYQKINNPIAKLDAAKLLYNERGSFISIYLLLESDEVKKIPEANLLKAYLFKHERSKYLSHLEEAAKSGCAEAAWVLAKKYSNSQDKSPNPRALEYLETAVRGGIPEALYTLTQEYINGGLYYIPSEQNGEPDRVKARECYEELVERNNDVAIFELARAYAEGVGCERNPLKSMQMYRQLLEITSLETARDVYTQRAYKLLVDLCNSDWENQSHEFIYNACIALDKVIVDKELQRDLMYQRYKPRLNNAQCAVLIRAESGVLESLQATFNNIAITNPDAFVKCMINAGDTIERISSILSPLAAKAILSRARSEIDEHFFHKKGEESLTLIPAEYLFFTPKRKPSLDKQTIETNLTKRIP